MIGRKFTWNRPYSGNLMVYRKLDMSLFDVAWRMDFPDAYVKELCKFHSNHNQNLLGCGLPSKTTTVSFLKVRIPMGVCCMSLTYAREHP